MYRHVEEKCIPEPPDKNTPRGFLDVAIQVRGVNQDFAEVLMDLNNLLQEMRRYSEPTEPSNKETQPKEPVGSLECLVDGLDRYKELLNTLRFSVRHLRGIM